MATQDFNNISAEVKIQGKSCDFSLLKLHQTMFGHHRFMITVNYRAKNLDVWNTTADKVLEHIGASITIQIKDVNGEMVDFVGVINKIDISGSDSDQGEVILYGGSPTVLMTDDYSMDSFEENDLASIVQETITNIGYPIEYKIEPVNNATIPYVCRYKESSYGFLRRLLAWCGEWFFYDGKKIVVGFSTEHGGTKDVELSYKHDISQMKISSTLGNFAVEQFDYDPTADRIIQWVSEPNSSHLNKFTNKAFKRSKEIHKDWTILPSKMPTNQQTFPLMENSVYAEHYQKLSDGSVLEAKTSTPAAGLGRVISVDIAPELDKYARSMGRFRVIDVLHTYDNTKAEYTNNISCVNADIDYIPSRDVDTVMAMPEIAKVVDNADPKNLGRVKVQFVWHQLEDHSNTKTSSWMRVQSPDAGSSDEVEKNRGFFFVPEIDDQVMVGYEYGDPSRPFVMGSLFHSNNAQGVASENAVKSIQTRSGIKIILNDSQQSVHIEDPSGSTWEMDGKGNITVNAPETMTLNAKKLEISTQEDIAISAGGKLDLSVEKEVKAILNADYTTNVKGKASIMSKDYANQSDQISIISGGKLNVEGGGAAKFAGKKIDIQGSANKLQLP